MNARLEIVNDDLKNTIDFIDISDKNDFSTYFNGDFYHIYINDGYHIEMVTKTHKTVVNINNNDDSYIQILDENGVLDFKIKIVEIIINNDMIFIAYTTNQKCSINIKYM